MKSIVKFIWTKLPKFARFNVFIWTMNCYALFIKNGAEVYHRFAFYKVDKKTDVVTAFNNAYDEIHKYRK